MTTASSRPDTPPGGSGQNPAPVGLLEKVLHDIPGHNLHNLPALGADFGVARGQTDFDRGHRVRGDTGMRGVRGLARTVVVHHPVEGPFPVAADDFVEPTDESLRLRQPPAWSRPSAM